MFPVLSIGPLSLPAAPLILLIGFWLGSTFAERKAKRSGKDPELISKIIWYALIGGILGARLSFIARNPSAFQGDWKSIFSLNQALLDPVGGLLISVVIVYLLASRNRLSVLSLLDELVPFFAVLAPAIYLSNFASGSGIGLLTELPWGIEQYGGPRHPVQLYLLISSLIVLYLSSVRQGPGQARDGSRFLAFVIFTSGYLAFFLSFQEPQGAILWGFRTKQIISWVFFSGSLYLRNQLTKDEVQHAAI